MNKLEVFAWSYGTVFVLMLVFNLFERTFAMMTTDDWTSLAMASLIFSVPFSIWLNKKQ